MNRKELYAKVKNLGAAEAIKSKFGDNYTRISNSDLEKFLEGFGKKEATPKKGVKTKAAPVNNSKTAMTMLLSTLQAKHILTAKEAEEIVSML